MTPQDIQDFKDKTERETIDRIIKKISVTDSFFYAEMVIMQHFDAMDPFGGEKIKCIIKMNLFNSKNFVKQCISDARPKIQTAKEIRSEIILESEDIIRSKEDAIMLIYEEVGKQIAQDLFQANGHQINKTIININERDTERKYI